MHTRRFIAAVLLLFLPGCELNDSPQSNPPSPPVAIQGFASSDATLPSTDKQDTVPIDFSQSNPAFRFAADIPASWQIEFVPEISALNIYDPTAEGETKREQSQFFVRFFEANSFLTLSTVNILSREEAKVLGHDAVRYEIEKKSTAAPFPHQPSWRNGVHRLVDIRLTTANPSLFYVFASSPSLDPAIFEAFIQSLLFHNDPKSYRPPLSGAQERITKKPFGLKVSPDRSPVEPERFSGFHTGADFEILPGEQSTEVAVSALCGGPVRSKQTAKGYGGLVVQECLLEGQTVTVIYGHLALSSVAATVGSYLAPTARIGLLGTAESEETDNERKHLHLGIHKGKALNVSGYVQRADQLSAWMNPLELF